MRVVYDDAWLAANNLESSGDYRKRKQCFFCKIWLNPQCYYRTESKRKLTFKERKEYETLEEEIMELEEEKSSIEQEMCSGTLDNDTLLKKSRRIQEVIELIDKKTERWMELSEFA